MKRNIYNNILVVLRRHIRILCYLLLTAVFLSPFILFGCKLSVFMLLPICSGYLLLREMFRLTLDMMESAFNIPALTRVRASFHNRREEGYKNRAKKAKTQ